MKKREPSNFKTRLHRFVCDRVFRAFFFAVFSFLITAVFAAYNVILWFIYGAAWNIGIGVYYSLLSGLRACTLATELRLIKQGAGEERQEEVRRKLYFMQGIYLFAVDLALIAPITFMVHQEKVVAYSAIPAIVEAAHATYKIILATRNYVKSRKERHLGVKILRNVSFIDALVSVLSLQYTLIMTFGNGITEEMLPLCSLTSIAVWGIIIFVSVFAMVDAVRLRKAAKC